MSWWCTVFNPVGGGFWFSCRREHTTKTTQSGFKRQLCKRNLLYSQRGVQSRGSTARHCQVCRKNVYFKWILDMLKCEAEKPDTKKCWPYSFLMSTILQVSYILPSRDGEWYEISIVIYFHDVLYFCSVIPLCLFHITDVLVDRQVLNFLELWFKCI